MQDKITYVQDYLSRNTSYSLSPGKLPKGKDFVEYFLYENKKGYCAHYASAATLMLRAMGVPARYVEGYVVKTSDINEESGQNQEELNDSEQEVEVSVRDSNAHAWLEIYYDEVGWILYDFTPSAGIRYSSLNSSQQDEVEGTIPTDEPITHPPTNEDKPDIPKSDTPDQDMSESDASGTDASSGSGISAADRQQLNTIFLIAFLILSITTLIGAVVLLIKRRKKILGNMNHNKRALVLYVQMEKILAACHELGAKGMRLEDREEYVKENCSYLDPEAFTTGMEIVRKARFGKGRISLEELRHVEALQRKLYQRAYQEQSLGKKLYLKLHRSVSMI